MSSKKKQNNFFYDFVKVTAAIPTYCWMRPKRIYKNKESIKELKGFLACANHNSFFDPVLMLCAFWNRRLYSLATKDLYKNKFLNWFFNAVKCIKVDKQNFSLESLREVTSRLKDGHALAIFPEGKINFDKENMESLKTGVVLMANQANVPVVPVYFVPIKHWYNRRIILIGEPIDVRSICGTFPSVSKLEEVTALIATKELELKEEYERRVK